MLNDKIRAILEPVAEGHGAAVVSVEHYGRTLSVTVESAEGGVLNIGAISKLSGEFSAVLDVHDLIAGKYNLEVGSAGTNRPLVYLDDFAKRIGKTARVEIRAIGDEQHTFTGKINAVEGSVITIGDKKLEFGEVVRANLVMTDEEFREILKSKKGAK